MSFFDDEVLSVNSTVKTLTASKINGSTGTAKASYARIELRTPGTTVSYTFHTDPSGTTGHILNPGVPVDVSGYDNLINMKFVLYSGVGPVSIFVSYAS